MRSIKQILTENKYGYILILGILAVNVAIQIPVQYLYKQSALQQTIFILFITFSGVWSLLHGLWLPMINYRFRVMYTGNRHKAYEDISKFTDYTTIIIGLLGFIGSRQYIITSDWGKQALGSFIDLKWFLLILFSMYALTHFVMYLTMTFLSKGLVKGIKAAGFYYLIYTLLLIGLYFLGAPYALVGVFVILVITVVYFKVKSLPLFYTCEF